MEWWIWVVSGLGLLCLELFVPSGFYIFFIGLACLVVGLLAALGLVTDFAMQFLSATGIGILLVFLLRPKISQTLQRLGTPTGSDLTAQQVRVVENIAPSTTGRGEMAGTTWMVRNDSSSSLHAGRTYPIARTEGLTLIVTE